VQNPGEQGDAEADCPPAGPEQRHGAGDRVAHVDVGRRDRALVLPEKREVRREGTAKREKESELNGQRWRKVEG